MPGQTYVALNRVASLAELFLIGNYTKAVFKVNNTGTNEYNTLRAEQAVAFCQLSETVLPEKLVILLLNVWLLRKHFGDIENSSYLVQSDILFFRTQILPLQGGSDLPAMMGGFYVTYNSSNDRFCILPLCYRDDLNLLNHVKMNGFSILTFHKPSFSDEYFEVILFYKKNSALQALLLSQLQDLICSEQIQIILGDFNTDSFDSDNYAFLSNSIERYYTVVQDPTHLSGSQMDHVYLWNTTLY